MQQIFKTILFLVSAIIFFGLLVLLFSIGLVALWYLLLISLAVWAIRRIYYFFKGEKPPSIVEQYYYYYNNTYTQTNKKKKSGRIIDYDDFKNK